jgi:P-type Mg2+ transporter
MTAQEVQSDTGLTTAQALENINKYGANVLESHKLSTFNILLRQFKGNYLVYILIVCTLVSFFLGERTSSIYIFSMIFVSSGLGFWNEYSAQKIVDGLLKRIAPKVLVKRDGEVRELLITQIAVGDVVLFSTGSVIPADLQVLQAENLEVNESALTGESAPVYKKIDDSVYMGTNVESGHGIGVITKVGRQTKYGQIAKNINFLKPETAFQLGLRGFGNMLVKVIFVLTGGIFLVNAVLGKDPLSSLMFALAVAVGLTPELLPVVVTLSLSHGAGKLSKKHVVVKQLVAVENLGNMDILCCDKTGTLTEGKIELTDFLDMNGQRDRKVLEKGYLSTPKALHMGVAMNSIDRAIINAAEKSGVTKSLGTIGYLDTESFDYNKKASFNVVKFEGDVHFLVKGVFDDVAKMCSHSVNLKAMQKMSDGLSIKGFRVVALAGKILENETPEYQWDEASDLTMYGILVFSDAPKKDAKKALERLENLNISLKLLTGDNEIVALKVCAEVGLGIKGVILGEQLDKLSPTEFASAVLRNNIFARVTPENKLSIIKALQAAGHTVGFMGDGINDAPALHTADVGISVDGGADVAKESASVVLMKKGLDVVAEGVMEGRRIFNNTVKYILMGTSSNFGNMFSASFASFVLPFLPMTPLQILLNNTLYDFSQLTIPSDNVDKESLLKPRHWDIGFIKKYMLFFGPISSLFDFVTFFCLMWVFRSTSGQFQTGWFLESLLTQTLVIFVIRTARTPFWKSAPSKSLIISALIVLSAALFLVLSPMKASFGFGSLTPQFFAFLVVVTIVYMFLVDKLKMHFIKRFKVWN